MRIVIILIILGTLQAHSNIAYSQKTRLTFDLSDVPVVNILDRIEAESEFFFLYNEKLLDTERKVSINAKNQLVESILDDLFTGTDVKYTIIDRKIILAPEFLTNRSATSDQHHFLITGTVTDNEGYLRPGVNVLVRGTTIGVITDSQGKYSISIPSSATTLIFSFIGMESQEINIGNRTRVDAILSETAIGLQEVVVIGYGTVRKSDLTGSISSIPNDKFSDQNVVRIDQALQGRATGLQVTNSGAPGGDVRIRIRGANSALGSNQPLYVVDGFIGADFNVVNPHDIESIQILKDASSTAIYGSRGSNGVIIITTKKGKIGGVQLNYHGNLGVSEVINRLDLLSAGDFAEIVNIKNSDLGLLPAFTQAQIDSYKAQGGTNWQDEIYQTAISNEQQISVSGGTDKITFLVSGNYLTQDGIVKNSGIERYIIRSNLNTDVNEKLSFRINLSGSNVHNRNNQTVTGPTNPIGNMVAWAPTTPVYDQFNHYTLNDPVGSLKANPVALLYDRLRISERSSANIVGGLRYELIYGLAIDMQYAADYSTQQNKNLEGNYVSNFNPTASIGSIQQVVVQGTNSVSFNKTVNQAHSINAVAVFETQQLTENTALASSFGLKFPELGYENLGQAEDFIAGSNFSKWTLMSYLGRLNYSFRNRYLISISIRKDGSSKFREGNKFSTFPAFALGWNLSNEDFFKNVRIINNLKVRASWGFVGSQAIQPYATESTYTPVFVSFNSMNLSSGIQLGNPGNKKLKWETTEQKDIGIEIDLFKGRLRSEFDYFIKNTTDLLLNRPLPYYAGGGVFASNVGEISNKGWEFSLSGTPISIRGLTWKSDFNISYVENEVVSLGGIADYIFTISNVGGSFSTQPEFIYIPGKPLGSYWGLKYLGTWKPDQAEEAALYGMKPGDVRYEDLDNNYIINNSDFQIIGNGLPRTSAGWNNTFAFKNISANIFFQGVFGVDKLNYTRAQALIGMGDNRQVTHEDIKKRYISGVNETSDIPAFSKTNKTVAQSTQFMESGNFIRLKNLSLSYDFPKSATWRFSGLRASVNATNLLTFTNYTGQDPEASSSRSSSDLSQSIDNGAYPNAKSYTFGINIIF